MFPRCHVRLCPDRHTDPWSATHDKRCRPPTRSSLAIGSDQLKRCKIQFNQRGAIPDMDQEFKLTKPNRLRRSPKGHYARKSPYTANTDDADITSFGLIAARCVIYQLAYFVR